MQNNGRRTGPSNTDLVSGYIQEVSTWSCGICAISSRSPRNAISRAQPQRLHIAQPPLSRQIQQLEETLGVQLLERNSRPLKLTETGKFFYSHAAQLLAQTAELESMTRRVGNIERSLSVGFVGSTLYGMLPKIIRRFRDENTDRRAEPPRNVDDGPDQSAERRSHRCGVWPYPT